MKTLTSVIPTKNGALPEQGYFSFEMPTSYAYSMGHSLSTPSPVVILADRRENHGGAGQICLAAGGSAEFRKTVSNDMGTDEKEQRFIDPDIYARNPEMKHPELDSYCR